MPCGSPSSSSGLHGSAGRSLNMSSPHLAWSDVWTAVVDGFYTLIRVVVLIALASLIWVPIGVWIGLRPSIAEKVQPLAQFLAAFPANILFPAAVVLIIHFGLNPNIWLSPADDPRHAMVYPVQCRSPARRAFPSDLKEAAGSFHLTGWKWWRFAILPGDLSLLYHRRDHRVGRVVERRHRRRSGELGRPEADGGGSRLLYRQRDRGGRFPPRRSRHRRDEHFRHFVQSLALASALCLR